MQFERFVNGCLQLLIHDEITMDKRDGPGQALFCATAPYREAALGMVAAAGWILIPSAARANARLEGQTALVVIQSGGWLITASCPDTSLHCQTALGMVGAAGWILVPAAARADSRLERQTALVVIITARREIADACTKPGPHGQSAYGTALS
jgi:hypothetical protein